MGFAFILQMYDFFRTYANPKGTRQGNRIKS